VAAARARAARAGPGRGRRRRRRHCVRGAAQLAGVSGVSHAGWLARVGWRWLRAGCCVPGGMGPLLRPADVSVAGPCMPPATYASFHSRPWQSGSMCSGAMWSRRRTETNADWGPCDLVGSDPGPGGRARTKARTTARRQTPTGANPAASAGGATTTSTSGRRTHQTRAARAGARAEVLERVCHVSRL